MKQVKLLKDHCEHRKGDVIEVTTMRAAYWQAIGLAVPFVEEKEAPKVYNTKEEKEVKRQYKRKEK